jgi:hypothetical protein
MKDNNLQLSTIIHNYLQLSTMKDKNLQWKTIIYNYLQLSTIIYNYLQLSTIIYNYLQWKIRIYNLSIFNNIGSVVSSWYIFDNIIISAKWSIIDTYLGI